MSDFRYRELSLGRPHQRRDLLEVSWVSLVLASRACRAFREPGRGQELLSHPSHLAAAHVQRGPSCPLLFLPRLQTAISPFH